MSIYSDLGYISNIVTGEFFSLNLPIYIYVHIYVYTRFYSNTSKYLHLLQHIYMFRSTTGPSSDCQTETY